MAGDASRGAYGARGQPGEGEYLDGLSDGGAASQAMDGNGLRLVTVEVNGREGVFKVPRIVECYPYPYPLTLTLPLTFAPRGTSTGRRPACRPLSPSPDDPGAGAGPAGHSSSSRTRRFHGLIAEVVHYNRLLSQREIVVTERHSNLGPTDL